MRLRELWDRVELLLPDESRGETSSVDTGKRLAEYVNTRRARNYYIERCGLAAVTVACAEELRREGREHEQPELMALATVLLSEPILDFRSFEVWPGGVAKALEILQAPNAQG